MMWVYVIGYRYGRWISVPGSNSALVYGVYVRINAIRKCMSPSLLLAES